MEVVPGNKSLLAPFYIVDSSSNLYRAIVEKSATPRGVKTMRKMKSYNETADHPSRSRPGKRVAPKAMPNTNTKKRRNMVK